MADIEINYGNNIVEFYNVSYKQKKAIETILHGMEDDTDIVSGEREVGE